MLMVKEGSGLRWTIRLCRLALQDGFGGYQRRLAGYPISGSTAGRSHPRHTYHLRIHPRKMGANQMTSEIQRAASDVKPTMTDQAVLDFCKTGFLSLEGIIPDATNRWVTEYLDREGVTPNALVTDKRYIEEVLLHPEVAGAARSLLGENFQLPDWMANHRLIGPTLAKQWHVDGGSGFERSCNLLQVFYIPAVKYQRHGSNPIFARISHCSHREGGTRSFWSLGRSSSDGGTSGVGIFYRLFNLAPTIREARSIDP